MWRGILGVLAGLVAWFVLVGIGGYLIRVSWPAYAAVEQAMAFNLAMMVARLTLSTVALFIASFALVRISAGSLLAAIVFGIVMQIAFIPIHLAIATKFPIWYHLFFLISLVAVPVLTAAIVGRTSGGPAQKAAA
jgi:hypothetical protein